MGILLMLVGLLGVVSGGAKLRGRVRTKIGHSPVSIAELLVGAVALVGSGIGLAAVRPVAWGLVVLATGLTFVATWTHAQRLRHFMEKRNQAEALRLQAYLLTHSEDSTSS